MDCSGIEPGRPLFGAILTVRVSFSFIHILKWSREITFRRASASAYNGIDACYTDYVVMTHSDTFTYTNHLLSMINMISGVKSPVGIIMLNNIVTYIEVGAKTTWRPFLAFS
jgi:hypothetical protein